MEDASFSMLKDKIKDVPSALAKRERVRQIEAKALRKMRHPVRIRQLEGFIELPGA
jgi:RNA polymerase primary sigma factor